MTGTAITTTQHNGSMAVYNRLPDPLQAATSIGEWLKESGMATTPGAGKILALSAICRGVDLVQFVSEHSVVMGRVTRNYELLLADLRDAGGDYEWLNTGDDGVEAKIKITWKKKKYEYTFTMEMAERAELVKPGSGWVKWRGNMLRSKCARHGMQMYCPEIIRGLTTPEDVEIDASPALQQTQASVEARRAELQQAQEDVGSRTEVIQGPKPVNAVPEPQPTPMPPIEAEWTETSSSGNGSSPPTPEIRTNDQLQVVASLGSQLGQELQQIVDGLKQRYEIGSLNDLTKAQASDAIDRMKETVEKKSQTLQEATA